MLANLMAPMNTTHISRQRGQGLVECMMGMTLSLLVVMSAFSAFAWIQRSQTILQSQMDTHQRMHTAIQGVRDRAQRAGAPELKLDSQGFASLAYLPLTVSGNDSQLQLMQFRSLTPADCQGHQASTQYWLQDDFRKNSSSEFTCKDSARSNSTYQALIEQVDEVRFRYAQTMNTPGTPAASQRMQWRTAAQVTDWHAIRAVQWCLQVRTNALTLTTLGLSCNKLTPLKNGAMAWRSVLQFSHASQ